MFGEGLVWGSDRLGVVDGGSGGESWVDMEFGVVWEDYMKVGVGVWGVRM